MLKIKHHAGFFSCTSVKLHHIIEYYNKEKKLPEYIDCSEIFYLYKPTSLMMEDITHHFFSTSNSNIIQYNKEINFNWNYQFDIYKSLDILSLVPFIQNYFSPTNEILSIKEYFIEKYKLNMNELCAVYYRGTDKFKETELDIYESYIEQMKKISVKTYLIQSDDQKFIDIVKKNFTNIIIIEENPTSYLNIGIHDQYTTNENYVMIKILLATILIMSKSKYFICSTSNCSLWAILYRGNTNNVFQNLNKKWITIVIQNYHSYQH